jgi:hypothetical protein
VTRRKRNGAAIERDVKGEIRGLAEEIDNERERSKGLVRTWQSWSQRPPSRFMSRCKLNALKSRAKAF